MADGAPGQRNNRYEWLDLEVPADTWWDIVDHPDVIERGLHGWTFVSCEPAADGRVVLTYSRLRKVPDRHPTPLVNLSERTPRRVVARRSFRG